MSIEPWRQFEVLSRTVLVQTGRDTKITLDAYVAPHRAVREMKEAGELPRRVKVRSGQYLNNLVGQDHWRIRQRIRPMLGFNDSTTRQSPLAESSWQSRSRRVSSRQGSSGIGNRLCRNCRMRRLLLDSLCGPSIW
jgi:transposase-like protein